jgi:ribosomal protein S16
MHSDSDNKLINISVSVDEAHLVKHIQQVVQRSLQHTRQEVLELRNFFGKLSDEVASLRKEFLVMQDVKLRGVVTTLIDVRTALLDSRAGAKGYHSAVRDRRQRQDAAEAAGTFDPASLFDRVGDRSHDSATVLTEKEDDVDLDSERISSLELQCAKLREQLRHLTDDATPAMFSALTGRLDAQASQSGTLMRHLGLEVHEQHSGILHTLQSVTESNYMKPFVDALGQNERRVRAAEDAAAKMCTKSELDQLRFAISDVRGACDATKASLSVATTNITDRLQSTVA